MSPLELRQELHIQLDQIPETQLPKLQQYLAELAIQSAPPTAPLPSTGASLLTALKSVGTWQGADFEECLQAVYESRSPAKFDNDNNPFT
jgi:hypothetical protein